MNPGFGDFPPFMYVAFAIFGVFFVVVLAFIGMTVVRSRRVLRDSGLDPLAAQAQIALRLAQGPLGTPARSLERRLAELDDLHRRGMISDSEHEGARRAALAGE